MHPRGVRPPFPRTHSSQPSERQSLAGEAPVTRGPISQSVLRQPVSQTMDHQVVELLERARVAEERAAHAEQHATYASQHAAYAEQQLAMQAAETASVMAQPAFAYAEPDPPPRGSAFATWSGWCLAVVSVGLAAAGYFMRYEPQRAQLAAQTKLAELQTSQRSEAEASLRANFDRERKALNEELAAARAANAAPASPTEALDARAKREPAEPADHAAAAKAAKQEARTAKHEAFLAKKAERLAKREERLAKRKVHTATVATTKKAAASGKKSESDEAPTTESKQKAKPAVDEPGGEASNNDPLEGL